jgi:uncharacterized protein
MACKVGSRVALVVAWVSAGSGCAQPGGVGEAVRPEAPAVQASLCDSVADFGQPLIVDLKAHERAVYEAVMQSGVAVVKYDCQRLHLLKDCKISGDYGFVGVSPKEEIVRLEGSDEIALNLPSFGAKIAAEVERNASLDLGMMMVGMRRTTVDRADRKRLEGSGCAQATHFVRGAFVGAFALKQGSAGAVRSAVEILGTGASASSKSAKRTENRDGDLDACKRSDPKATAPETSCAALLRLELTAIDVAPRDDAGSADVCPKDLVLVSGKCAPPTSAAPFQCREGQLDECMAQCEKAHAGSCAAASFMYFGNHGVTPDPEKAASYAATACEGGNARGCGNMGHAYDRGDALPRDLAKARDLYKKSCDGGWARGCSNLGVLAENDGDPAAANTLFDRACSGGEARACHYLALNLDKGKGTAPDAERAKALFVRACDGKHEDACGLLSSQLLSGTEEQREKGVKGLEQSCAKGSAAACRLLGTLRLSGTKLPRDPVKAVADFERACEGKDHKSCVDAAALLISGSDGVPKNAEKAALLSKRACDGGHTPGCRLVAVGHLRGQGAGRDDATALKLLEKSCADGDGESCAGAGLLYRHGYGSSPNPSLAAGFFDKACSARFGYGCALLAAARFDALGGARDLDATRLALSRACSAGYGSACGLSHSPPRVYEVTPPEDPFGIKGTAAGSVAPGSRSAAASMRRSSSASEPPSALEQRRTNLKDRLKGRLGVIKSCARAAGDYDRSHYVKLVVDAGGKTRATLLAAGAGSKLGSCFAKAVASIKIPAGEHTIQGTSTLRWPKGRAPTLALTIEPDPSELTLPPAVRRFAGCACGDTDGVVCAIECRSGSGPTGPIAGTGGNDFDWEKHTAPAKTGPDPFEEKRSMPSAPKPSKARR